MRYFRDGVLKMIIKKVLPGDGSTFLYHNSGSFHGKAVSYTHLDVYKRQGLSLLMILMDMTWGTDC